MTETSNVSLSLTTIPLKSWNLISLVQEEGAFSAYKYSNATRVGPYVYITGRFGDAYHQEGKSVAVIPVLNLQSNEWKFIPIKGYMRDGMGIFLFDSCLYMLSRHDYTGSVTGKLSRFDLVLNEWSYCHTVGEGPGPIRYLCGNFLEHMNRYVVFGGDSNREKNEVYVLDMPGCQWIKAKAKGVAPEGRRKAGSCVHKGIIYILGGLYQAERFRDGLFLLQVGSGQTVTWSSPKTNVLDFLPRSSFTFFPLGDVLLMYGGFPEHNGRRLASYNTVTQEFRNVKADARFHKFMRHGACNCPISNGKSAAVFFGGGDVDQYVRIRISHVA